MQVPINDPKPFGKNGKTKQIAYAIFPGGECVFTATDSKPPSTINAFEFIIFAIPRPKDKKVSEMEFFDLRTCRGYNNIPVGEFDFEEIVFQTKEEFGKEHIISFGWKERQCSPEIQNLFRKYIEDEEE